MIRRISLGEPCLPTAYCLYRLKALSLESGSRNIDQSLWTMSSRTKTSRAPVCRPLSFTVYLCRFKLRHAVEKFIEKNRLPHLLFYGPPGTGKTSTILAVARRIYGKDYKKQILEVCCQFQLTCLRTSLMSICAAKRF